MGRTLSIPCFRFPNSSEILRASGNLPAMPMIAMSLFMINAFAGNPAGSDRSGSGYLETVPGIVWQIRYGRRCIQDAIGPDHAHFTEFHGRPQIREEPRSFMIRAGIA